MAAKLRDYYVPYRREETIADTADLWRHAAMADNAPYFNVVKFVQGILAPSLARQKTELKFRFFTPKNNEDFAYVSVEPLTLNIDEEIWELAERGDPFSRLVVSHEIGHIVLHGDYEKAAFSNDSTSQLKAIPQGNSAEWQAIIFAEHFLLPDRIVESYSSSWDIVKSCGVQRELAEKRFAQVRENKLRKQQLSNFCPTCGEFSCSDKH